MANPLTGDFEACVQVAVRQLNGLLGTLHQAGGVEDAPLKLLHSVSMRVGDPRRRPPEVGDFGDWVLELQRAGPGRGLQDIRDQLTGTAPPGAAQRLADEFAAFDEGWVLEDPPVPDLVRGRVKLQLSSVALSVPSGSTSEVGIEAHVRAHYFADAGTNDLPAPIHGVVRAAFEVRRVQSAGGRRLAIKPSSQDSKIVFAGAPGSGLNSADESRITKQVRKALREDFDLVPVDLPPGFPFTDFKGVGSGADEAVALPLQLSGAAPPASGPQAVARSFVGGSGFGFAVRPEHVSGLVDVEGIRESIRRRRITIGVDLGLTSVTATYRLRFSSGPTLTFRSNSIDVSGRVEVETSTTLAPNGFVSFKQAIRLTLNPSTQAVGLERVGEPDIDKSWFIPRDRVAAIVKSEIDNALRESRGPVGRVFSDAKTTLVDGLRNFDASASASYTDVEITSDGVIVRGEIGSAARRAPVVDVAETHQGAAFSAFDSWIPAGRIDRFSWSWVEYSNPSIWSGVEKSAADEHGFVLPRPSGIASVSQICLRIEGSQVRPDGHESAIAVGTVCRVPEPEIGLDAPSWWEPVTVPVWRPDADEDTVLRDAIAAHVSIQRDVPQRGQPSANSLVHFVDWDMDRPLEAVGPAVARMRDELPLVVVAVLPAGAFDARRRELEAKLGWSGQRPGQLLVTEDQEDGWSRTFAVEKAPSSFIVNARREFVWKYEGALEPGLLVEALDEHLLPGPAPGVRGVRTKVSVGGRPPDAVFATDGGDRMAVHRLRQGTALLNFFQPWSAPCLAELQRLQSLHERGREAPSVIAFHGGKSADRLDELRKQLGLSFPLVHDAQQRIARRYGVRCWPTTISVGPAGFVEQVQLGTAHEHGDPDHPQQSTSA